MTERVSEQGSQAVIGGATLLDLLRRQQGEVVGLGLILAVVVLLFGATKLPQLAGSLGQSAKEFRKGLDEGGEEDEESGANAGN